MKKILSSTNIIFQSVHEYKYTWNVKNFPDDFTLLSISNKKDEFQITTSDNPEIRLINYLREGTIVRFEQMRSLLIESRNELNIPTLDIYDDEEEEKYINSLSSAEKIKLDDRIKNHNILFDEYTKEAIELIKKDITYFYTFIPLQQQEFKYNLDSFRELLNKSTFTDLLKIRNNIKELVDDKKEIYINLLNSRLPKGLKI